MEALFERLNKEKAELDESVRTTLTLLRLTLGVADENMKTIADELAKVHKTLREIDAQLNGKGVGE